MKFPKAVLRGIGIVSILLAALGLSYSGTTLLADFSKINEDHDVPYFFPAFYTMSAICIACYLLLVAVGIQFLRLKTNVVWPFVLLLIFEILYFFSVGAMWLHPSFGLSVGAATGVANGGLMFQAIILFPIWAIPVSLWASHKLKEEVMRTSLAPEL